MVDPTVEQWVDLKETLMVEMRAVSMAEVMVV